MKIRLNKTNPLIERVRRWIRPDPSVIPVDGYASSIVDSQGCEFGFEMYYHVPYAYHLAQRGLLETTISTKDTSCFYWFSPNHIERYERRSMIHAYPSIDQLAHVPPDFSRWQAPDFQSHYAGRVDFGFDKPLLLIFNKYNREWDGPPINFLSRELLYSIADAVKHRFQVVYFRPTGKIVMDNCELLELDEKAGLAERGVLMAEELHDRYADLSFNEFQLCLLAQSRLRIAVQGGAAYLNALFRGKLYVLHRRGSEIASKTYTYLESLSVDQITVKDDESALWDSVRSDSRAAFQNAKRRAS